MRMTALVLAICLTGSALPAGEQPASGFSSQTIDIGLVVSDLDKSMEFYTKVIGFKKVGTLDVPAEMGKESGLSDNQPFHIEMLALGDEKTATKLKLMAFPNTKPAKPDNQFIHSTLGVSYLTIFVDDMSAALERAKAAGAKPVAKGPIELPASIAKGISLVLLRDPDGNFVELVGPMKEQAE